MAQASDIAQTPNQATDIRGGVAAVSNPIHVRAFKGAAASGVGVAVQLIIQIFQVPLLLHVWSKEQYGMWVAIFAAFSLLCALDLGHQTFVANLLNRFYFESRELFQRTLASGLLMTFVLGLVEFLVLLLVVTNERVGSLLGFKTAGWGHAEILALVFLFAAWAFVQNPIFMIGRVWVPMGQFARSQLWSVVFRVCQFSIALAVALLGGTVMNATVGWVVGGLVACIFLFWDLGKSAKEFYPWWRGGSVREGAGNWLHSVWMTSIGILDQVATSGVTLMISQGAGLAALPAFVTVRTLANIATTGTGVVLSPLQIDFVRFNVNHEYDKLGQAFGVVWFGLGTFIALVLVGFSPFVGTVYRLWTHGALSFDYVLYAALGLSVAVRGVGAPLQNYIVFINHLTALSWGAGFRTIIAIGGTMILIPKFGLVGVGIAVALAELAGSFLVPLWYVAAEFRAHRETFPWQPLCLALAGLTVAGASLFVAGLKTEFIWECAIGGIGVISALAWYQWKELSADVRSRMSSLLFRLVPRFA